MTTTNHPAIPTQEEQDLLEAWALYQQLTTLLSLTDIKSRDVTIKLITSAITDDLPHRAVPDRLTQTRVGQFLLENMHEMHCTNDECFCDTEGV